MQSGNGYSAADGTQQPNGTSAVANKPFCKPIPASKHSAPRRDPVTRHPSKRSAACLSGFEIFLDRVRYKLLGLADALGRHVAPWGNRGPKHIAPRGVPALQGIRALGKLFHRYRGAASDHKVNHGLANWWIFIIRHSGLGKAFRCDPEGGRRDGKSSIRGFAPDLAYPKES